MMLEQSFSEVYTKFKLQFYTQIFSKFQTREPSLTAVEIFCVEVIYALNRPTINEFASFAQISGPNATYKVNSLVKKGYIKKIQSNEDKREFYLEVTNKFLSYYGITYDYIKLVVNRMQDRFSPEQIQTLETMLTVISQELMPEVTMKQPALK